MNKKKKVLIGTRSSKLALKQAKIVKQKLEEKFPAYEFELEKIKTSADKNKNEDLSEIGGKGLFVKELEEALLDKKIDMAIHSMKDVPTLLPKGLKIVPILEREDPQDVFISRKYKSFLGLPKKSRVATGSLRRRSQLKNFRPDIEILPIRGNLDTRIKKVEEGKVESIVVAAAGLKRLGWEDKITEYISTTLMLPAVGQGALGLEIRTKEDWVFEMANALVDPVTEACILAERAFQREMGGDCNAPITAHAEMNRGRLCITGMVASVEGRDLIRDRFEGSVTDARYLGEKLAKSLFARGAREVIRGCHEYLKK